MAKLHRPEAGEILGAFEKADIVHAHDWHAGLAPAYLAALPPAAHHIPTVFTVHNLAYQGLFSAALFPELALPPGFLSIDGVEFHGLISFMKAGLFYSDRLTTVSPTYAREIQTGLNRQLRKSRIMLYAADALFRHREQQLSIARNTRRRVMHLRIINAQCQHIF